MLAGWLNHKQLDVINYLHAVCQRNKGNDQFVFLQVIGQSAWFYRRRVFLWKG